MTLSRSSASLVTDAIVEKAARAQWGALRDRVRSYELEPFECLDHERQEDWLAETRAGLEAVEGDIIEEFGASGVPLARAIDERTRIQLPDVDSLDD